MEQVHCGPKHLHLSSHRCDLVPVPWEEPSNGSQLISAVVDIPDLIVKVPAEDGACTRWCMGHAHREAVYVMCSSLSLGQIVQVHNPSVKLPLYNTHTHTLSCGCGLVGDIQILTTPYLRPNSVSSL